MDVMLWTRLSEKSSWWDRAVERKRKDGSLPGCQADKCCLKSKRSVPACTQTQAIPISCVTDQAVVDATGNRLGSFWKGTVSAAWPFINHYFCRSGIMLIDYTGGRKGDWSGWQRVANNTLWGFDCSSSIQQTTIRNSTSKPFFYKCVVNLFRGNAPQSFEFMTTEMSCFRSNWEDQRWRIFVG